MASPDWSVVLSADDGYELQPPASDDQIRAVSTALAAAFPDELVSLYRTSNGVFDRPGQWFVVWPVEQVLARNRDAWAIEGPERRDLVGFADDGTGAPFCVRRRGGGEVLDWSPIDGTGVVIAQSILEFWTGWVDGALPR